MKQLTNILLAFGYLLLAGCGQGKINVSDKAMTALDSFKSKEKFVEDIKLFYPGIGDPTLKPVLTEKINLAADDFKVLANKGTATDKDYQDAIKAGLERFSSLHLQLDTEDRERICQYFEELMDIVGLQSSGGHLNNFMYG